MKVCTKCKIEKDLSEFNKDKTLKFGITSKCKSCINDYYRANKEKHNQITKEHYKANREKRLEYNKEYFKSKQDGYHYVYLLPKENYVGCTNNVYWRMCDHRNQNRDTSGYIILGRSKDRDAALQLEKEYHDKGYAGRHPSNRYV